MPNTQLAKNEFRALESVMFGTFLRITFKQGAFQDIFFLVSQLGHGVWMASKGVLAIDAIVRAGKLAPEEEARTFEVMVLPAFDVEHFKARLGDALEKIDRICG